MTNTSNTLHLSCFYLFSRTIDSVTFVSLLCMAISISSLYKCTRSPLNTFKCSSILESFWPSSFHTRKGSYVSLTCGLGHKLRHQTFDPWTDRWILSSVEVLSHCSPESKHVLKIPKQALIFFVSPITFSSSTSTSSRLFAIMLIRSAKLFLSMHSPRCFTTNQSGKVSLGGKSIKRKYVFQLVWSMEVWFDKDIKSFACQAFLLSSSSPRHDFPAIDLSWLAKDNSVESFRNWFYKIEQRKFTLLANWKSNLSMIVLML